MIMPNFHFRDNAYLISYLILYFVSRHYTILKSAFVPQGAAPYDNTHSKNIILMTIILW